MLPGNIFLRSLTPHRQLGGSALIFGTLLCGMAAAQNYAAVLALRILLGAAQAFIQGLGLYTSIWYKRDEVATRGGKCSDLFQQYMLTQAKLHIIPLPLFPGLSRVSLPMGF